MTNVLHQVNQAGATIFRIKLIKIYLDFLQTADKGHIFLCFIHSFIHWKEQVL